MTEKTGSSGRTRTYNPPVNSCENATTANYRQLLLSSKINAFAISGVTLSTGKFDWGTSKSPQSKSGLDFDISVARIAAARRSQ